MPHRARALIYGLTALAVGLVVAMLLSVPIVTAQIRATQLDRQPQTEKNDETLAVIRDCTQPTGQCFKDGQKRTAEAVSQIGAGNILAVVCALAVPDGTPTNVALEQVTECVTKRLAAQQAAQQP